MLANLVVYRPKFEEKNKLMAMFTFISPLSLSFSQIIQNSGKHMPRKVWRGATPPCPYPHPEYTPDSGGGGTLFPLNTPLILVGATTPLSCPLPPEFAPDPKGGTSFLPPPL